MGRILSDFFLLHLFTQNLGLDGRLEHQVFEDGGEWGDSDSSSHQNRHLKVNPLLMALTKRAIQVQLDIERNMNSNVVTRQMDGGAEEKQPQNTMTCLWIGSELDQALFGVELSELAGPGPHGSDVQAQGLFVRC